MDQILTSTKIIIEGNFLSIDIQKLIIGSNLISQQECLDYDNVLSAHNDEDIELFDGLFYKQTNDKIILSAFFYYAEQKMIDLLDKILNQLSINNICVTNILLKVESVKDFTTADKKIEFQLKFQVLDDVIENTAWNAVAYNISPICMVGKSILQMDLVCRLPEMKEETDALRVAILTRFRIDNIKGLAIAKLLMGEAIRDSKSQNENILNKYC